MNITLAILAVFAAFTASAFAQEAPAPWLAVDLRGGPDAEAYPVARLEESPALPLGDEWRGGFLLLRLVPPGRFAMGSPGDEPGRTDAERLRDVTLTAPFYLGVFEVTQDQWRLVTGGTPSHRRAPDHPVEGVSYPMARGPRDGNRWPLDDAVDPESFVGLLRRKTGLRFDLPTEAEWEYACRAGSSGPYGVDGDLEAFARQSGSPKPAGHVRVGSLAPNAWGFHDMHGNVWEWCLDYGSDLPGPTPDTDPVGPPAAQRAPRRIGKAATSSGSDPAERRVVRGGGYSSAPAQCRSAHRSDSRPDADHANLGLRLAVHLSPRKTPASDNPGARESPLCASASPREANNNQENTP